MLYEVHVTVNTDDIELFRSDCNKIGVKPILIETERKGLFNNQVMTSSKHTGDDFKPTLDLITSQLRDFGYEVLRKKIEILPEENKHDDFIYYESHMRLKLPKGFNRGLLLEFCRIHDFHLSKNLFKSCEGFDYQMMTYRDNSIDYEEFVKRIEHMKTVLRLHRIEFDKVEIEECIFDSNIFIDKNWI